MKKINKNRINKTGAAGLQMSYLVKAILLAILLICVIFAAVVVVTKGNNWKDLLPDFIRGNSTYYGVRGCPSGTDEIGFINTKGYIAINNENTILYIKESKVYADIKALDEQVGAMVNSPNGIIFRLMGSGIEYMIDKGRLSDPIYKSVMPSKDNLKLLTNTFLEGSSYCVDNSYMNQINKKKSCIITCSLVEGVCSSTAVSGKIFGGQFDCPKGQNCYIDQTLSKLNSQKFNINNNLSILLTYFDDYLKNQKTIVLDNIIKSDNLTLAPGYKYTISTNVNVKSNEFCYSYDTSKITQMIEYMPNTDSIQKQLNTPNTDGYNFNLVNQRPEGLWIYGDEKYAQLIVWSPDYSEKVIKRWKIESRPITDKFGFPGKIIRDDQFLSELTKAPVLDKEDSEKSTFYVILTNKYTFYQTFSFKTTYSSANIFRIQKVGSETISINAYLQETGEFHKLKCGGEYSLWYDLPLKDSKQSLTESLANCKWW